MRVTFEMLVTRLADLYPLASGTAAAGLAGSSTASS